MVFIYGENFKGRFIIMFGKLWSACLHKKTVSSRKKMFWQLKILMVGLPRIGSFSHKSFETFVKVQNYIIGLFSGLTQAVLLVHVTPLFAFCTYITIHFFLSGFMMSTTFLINWIHNMALPLLSDINEILFCYQFLHEIIFKYYFIDFLSIQND